MAETFLFKGMGLAIAATSLMAFQREVASLGTVHLLTKQSSRFLEKIRIFLWQWYAVGKDLWADVSTLLSPAMAGLVVLALVQWVFLPSLSPLSRKMTCLALLGLFHIRFALQVFHLSKVAPQALSCFWQRKTQQYAVGQVCLVGASLALLAPTGMPFRLLAGVLFLIGGLLQVEEGPFRLTSDPALLASLGRLKRYSEEPETESRQGHTEAPSSINAFSFGPNTSSSQPSTSKFPLPPFLQAPRKNAVSPFPKAFLFPEGREQAVQHFAQGILPPWEEWTRNLDFLFMIALTVDLVHVPRSGGIGGGALFLQTAFLCGLCEALFPLLPPVAFPHMTRTLRYIGLPLVIGLIFLAFLGDRS